MDVAVVIVHVWLCSSLSKRYSQIFPPIFVLGENYRRREETVVCAQTEWNLSEADKRLESLLVVRIFDGREMIVGPASTDGSEDEREFCEGRKSYGEGDWKIAVKSFGTTN